MRCPLCHSQNVAPLSDKYEHCPRCDLRFLDPRYRLSPTDELERYRLHQNDIHSEAYRNFLQPAVDAVTARQGATGLDYGCGADSLGAKMLQEKGYEVALYDPFFHPDRKVLVKTFDFVIATEVVEHFYDPGEELRKLRSLLKPQGQLIVMTALYRDGIDFDSWYYRRDPTHVVFYSAQTFQWIGGNLGYSAVHILGDKVVALDA